MDVKFTKKISCNQQISHEREMTQQGSMYCPKCGRIVPSDALLCPYCGVVFQRTVPSHRKKNRLLVPSIGAIIIIIVISVIVFNLLHGGLPNSGLKITAYQKISSMDVGGGRWSWGVLITVRNTGSSNVYGAKLIVELRATDHTTIDYSVYPDSDTLSLDAGESIMILFGVSVKLSQLQNNNCQLVATVYSYDGKVIDQYITPF